jgi:uncharacterized LabA/DUF88 family protein
MPYQSHPPTTQESTRYSQMDAFLSYLRKLPRFEIRLGRLQKIGNEFKQKGIDVWFSVDLCKLSCKGVIDKAVLVTGDSDFVPAVNVAKEEGVVTILYYSKTPPLYVHNELLNACDEKYEINKGLIVASKP